MEAVVKVQHLARPGTSLLGGNCRSRAPHQWVYSTGRLAMIGRAAGFAALLAVIVLGAWYFAAHRPAAVATNPDAQSESR